MAKRPKKKRQRDILDALVEMGGTATTEQIAHALSLSVNGISQSLGVLQDGYYVSCLGGRGGQTRWQAVPSSD